MIHIQLSQEPISGVNGKPGDQQVLSLVISQQEGQAALAELTFSNTSQPYTWCAIAENETLLFVGQLVGLGHLDAHTFQITYRACQALPIPPKHLPYDPLFFDEPYVSQYLEASPYFFYINRYTGLPQLSHIQNGTRSISLSRVLKAETRTLHSPYKSVRAVVEVEWVQRHSGTFDLAPSLHAACEGGQLHTLTPQSLIQAWPKEGPFLSAERGKNNGYTVIESHVEPSCRAGDDSQTSQPTSLNGHIWIHWRYAQKRSEIVQFEVSQNLPHLWNTENVHTLKWRLQAIDSAENPAISSTTSSFFNDERGQKALQYAVLLAHHHLHMSRRCLETTLIVPFETLRDITLDDTIVWGDIQGKVYSYRFTYQHGRAVGEVRIRHSVPCEDESLPAIAWKPIQPEGFGDMPPSTLIEQLDIHNTAQDQQKHLASGWQQENLPPTKFFVRLATLGQHQALVEKVDLGNLSV